MKPVNIFIEDANKDTASSTITAPGTVAPAAATVAPATVASPAVTTPPAPNGATAPAAHGQTSVAGAVNFMPAPVFTSSLKQLKEEDPELYAAWRDYIRAGFRQNGVMFQRILSAFMIPYRLTVIMHALLFAIGVCMFIAGVSLSLWTAEPVYALAFGGLGAVTFLAFFISGPVKAVEENLEFITWLGIVYNTYWSRLVSAQDPKTSLQDMQALTEDSVKMMREVIDKHDELRGKRPTSRS